LLGESPSPIAESPVRSIISLKRGSESSTASSGYGTDEGGKWEGLFRRGSDSGLSTDDDSETRTASLGLCRKNATRRRSSVCLPSLQPEETSSRPKSSHSRTTQFVFGHEAPLHSVELVSRRTKEGTLLQQSAGTADSGVLRLGRDHQVPGLVDFDYDSDTEPPSPQTLQPVRRHRPQKTETEARTLLETASRAVAFRRTPSRRRTREEAKRKSQPLDGKFGEAIQEQGYQDVWATLQSNRRASLARKESDLDLVDRMEKVRLQGQSTSVLELKLRLQPSSSELLVSHNPLFNQAMLTPTSEREFRVGFGLDQPAQQPEVYE